MAKIYIKEEKRLTLVNGENITATIIFSTLNITDWSLILTPQARWRLWEKFLIN